MNKVYLLGTGDYAKERLSAILASDRIGCSPGFMDDMRRMLKKEVDRYIDVSESDIDIQVKERMLIAYIPLISAAKGSARSAIHIQEKAEQGLDNYDSSEKEGFAELKTVQS